MLFTEKLLIGKMKEEKDQLNYFYLVLFTQKIILLNS